MMITFRSNRILILAAVLVFGTATFIFYPSDHFRSPHSPQDPYDTYEAGGIDSEHWRERIVPSLEDEQCTGASCDVESDAPKVIKRPPIDKPKAGIKPVTQEELAHQSFDEAIDQERLEDEQARDGTHDVIPTPKTTAITGGLVLEDSVLHGKIIMPKLENATAKAELGRSAWKVMHLMTLRYPEVPTEDDRLALKSYFHLFSRLYPCGECAEEFQKLLKEYPPQTSSRKTASMWMCSIHNMVNARLGKQEFDCLTLNDVYDCGCGPEGEDGKGGEAKATEAGEKPKTKAKANRPLGGLGGKGKTNIGAEPGSEKDAEAAAVDVNGEHDQQLTGDEAEEVVYRPPKADKEHTGKMAVVAEKEELLEEEMPEDDGLVENREAVDEGDIPPGEIPHNQPEDEDDGVDERGLDGLADDA